jgi:hypothetical protein
MSTVTARGRRTGLATKPAGTALARGVVATTAVGVTVTVASPSSSPL